MMHNFLGVVLYFISSMIVASAPAPKLSGSHTCVYDCVALEEIDATTGQKCYTAPTIRVHAGTTPEGVYTYNYAEKDLFSGTIKYKSYSDGGWRNYSKQLPQVRTILKARIAEFERKLKNDTRFRPPTEECGFSSEGGSEAEYSDGD